jgi:hypothetical protein
MTAQIPSDFQVFAEIAIALAGFVGIIGALRTREGRGLTDRERLHTAVLLMASVLVLFQAFVPSWLSLLPGAEGQVWRWSMWVLLGTHLLTWVVFVPVLRAAIVVPEQFPQIERAFLVRAFSPWRRRGGL